MSLKWFFQPSRTPEQEKEILQARKDLLNELDTLTMNTKTAVERKEILPETATALYTLLKGAQLWLNTNSSADPIGIVTKKQEVQTTYKQIMDTEPKRKLLLAWMAATIGLVKDSEVKEKLQKDSFSQLEKLVNTSNTWYSKQSLTATPAEFDQQIMDMTSQTNTLVTQTKKLTLKKAYVRKLYEQRYSQFQKVSPADLRTELDKYGLTAPQQTAIQKEQAALLAKSQKEQEEAAKPVDPVDVIVSTALQTFFLLILFVVCLLGGSFSANFAIGRSRPYRVLYFIWGAIPIFAPFVILYAIYKRIREGPLPLYGILPLSVEPATTRLGKILWYPFYWIPDEGSKRAMDVFSKSLLV